MNRMACSPAAACSRSAATLTLRDPATPTFSVKMRNREASHYLGNDEPSLDELLGDDVLRRVMARDGVQPDHVRALAGYVRA
jgi:hypothetical protein